MLIPDSLTVLTIFRSTPSLSAMTVAYLFNIRPATKSQALCNFGMFPFPLHSLAPEASWMYWWNTRLYLLYYPIMIPYLLSINIFLPMNEKSNSSAPAELARKKETILKIVSSINECTQRDLNPHPCYRTWTWTMRVCQFRHACRAFQHI